MAQVPRGAMTMTKILTAVVTIVWLYIPVIAPWVALAFLVGAVGGAVLAETRLTRHRNEVDHDPY